jgi:hypothetical protein
LKWRRRESNRADSVRQSTETDGDKLLTPGKDGVAVDTSVAMEDDELEQGALDCSNCTKERGAAGLEDDAHQRAASGRLPDVELGLFLLAGDRIVAARPADTRQFDISSNQILATITTNPDPRNIAFDGTYLWVSASASDVIMKVDPRTNSIIDTIQLPAGSGPYETSSSMERTCGWTRRHPCPA